MSSLSNPMRELAFAIANNGRLSDSAFFDDWATKQQPNQMVFIGDESKQLFEGFSVKATKSGDEIALWFNNTTGQQYYISSTSRWMCELVHKSKMTFWRFVSKYDILDGMSTFSVIPRSEVKQYEAMKYGLGERPYQPEVARFTVSTMGDVK